MVYRRKPEDLIDMRPILDAMGRCRQVLIAQGHKVRPFGATYKAIRLVTLAIDELAKFLTGSESYYHASGSSPGSDSGRWRDSGSGL